MASSELKYAFYFFFKLQAKYFCKSYQIFSLNSFFKRLLLMSKLVLEFPIHIFNWLEVWMGSRWCSFNFFIWNGFFLVHNKGFFLYKYERNEMDEKLKIGIPRKYNKYTRLHSVCRKSEKHTNKKNKKFQTGSRKVGEPDCMIFFSHSSRAAV